MKIQLITAVSKNGIIGNNNSMPWHLPGELQVFKKHTRGTVMVMGRNTYESLPGLLPNREHWIISRTLMQQAIGRVRRIKETPKVRIFRTYEDAIGTAQDENKDVSIIGGAQIYKLAIDMSRKKKITIDRFIISKLDKMVLGDTYFPYINDILAKYKTEVSEPVEAVCQVSNRLMTYTTTVYSKGNIFSRLFTRPTEELLDLPSLLLSSKLERFASSILVDENYNQVLNFCNHITSETLYGPDSYVTSIEIINNVKHRLNGNIQGTEIPYPVSFDLTKRQFRFIIDGVHRPFAQLRGMSTLTVDHNLSEDDALVVHQIIGQTITKALNL